MLLVDSFVVQKYTNQSLTLCHEQLCTDVKLGISTRLSK